MAKQKPGVAPRLIKNIMTKDTLLPQLFNLTKGMVGFDFLYFDTAVEIKLTPHTHPVSIWGVTANKDGSVYLMTGDQKWYQLEETDLNYSLVVSSVLQRVKYLSGTKKTA